MRELEIKGSFTESLAVDRRYYYTVLKAKFVLSVVLVDCGVLYGIE